MPRSRSLWLALIGAVLALASTTPARADEQPSILQAYSLDWIARLPESAFPQPKAQRPVVCLLDTGVAITPDTPADDPNGPIVARLAVDGGSGLPQGDEPLHRHGTQMASVIAAPQNGWGTVGVFPQARIVSVRVTEGTDTYITPAAMVKGVRMCLDWSDSNHLRPSVGVMAESNYGQRVEDRQAWEIASAKLSDWGGVLVAAVGNQPDADLPLPPLKTSGVFPVAASGADGARCAFNSGISQPVLWAPGCGVAGWPSGSSTATAVAGATIAAGVALKPFRHAADVARDLILGGTFDGSVRPIPAADAPPVAMAPSSPPAVVLDPMDRATEVVRLQPSAGLPVRLWRPRATVRWRRNRLHVRVSGGVTGKSRVHVRVSGTTKQARRGRKRFSLRLRRRPSHVLVWVQRDGRHGWQTLRSKVRVKQS